jgi:hypothetical protein
MSKEDVDVKVIHGVINNYAGQYVSINLAKNNYFGVGEDGKRPKLWLSQENWFDKIPEGLTASEAEIIHQALEDGTIVFDKCWLPPFTKDTDVLKKYIGLLSRTNRLAEDFKEKIRTLFRYKKEGNYTALEIFQAMLVSEKENRRRAEFIAYLQEAIDNYSGPTYLVEDYPEDPYNYEATIDPITMKVVTSTRKPDMPTEPAPLRSPDGREPKKLDDPELRARKIDSVL